MPVLLAMHEIHVIPWLGLREPFNVLSHLLGAVVFCVLAMRLISRAQRRPERTVGLAIMAYTSVQTLVLSSAYHMCWPGPLRTTLLNVDVAGIFLLIAGCMTPVHLILFTGRWRWIPLSLAWTVACIGAGWKLSSPQGQPGWTVTLFFLLFGWAGVITAVKLWRRHGWAFLQNAVYAGLAYTIGAVILLQHRLTPVPGVIGPHEIWHLAVLCGLGLHWRFVLQITARDGTVPYIPRPHLLTTLESPLPLESLQLMPVDPAQMPMG